MNDFEDRVRTLFAERQDDVPADIDLRAGVHAATRRHRTRRAATIATTAAAVAALAVGGTLVARGGSGEPGATSRGLVPGPAGTLGGYHFGYVPRGMPPITSHNSITADQFGTQALHDYGPPTVQCFAAAPQQPTESIYKYHDRVAALPVLTLRSDTSLLGPWLEGQRTSLRQFTVAGRPAELVGWNRHDRPDPMIPGTMTNRRDVLVQLSGNRTLLIQADERVNLSDDDLIRMASAITTTNVGAPVRLEEVPYIQFYFPDPEHSERYIGRLRRENAQLAVVDKGDHMDHWWYNTFLAITYCGADGPAN